MSLFNLLRHLNVAAAESSRRGRLDCQEGGNDLFNHDMQRATECIWMVGGYLSEIPSPMNGFLILVNYATWIVPTGISLSEEARIL
jgi:hypothetical protein